MSLEEAMDNFTRGRRRKYGPLEVSHDRLASYRERAQGWDENTFMLCD